MVEMRLAGRLSGNELLTGSWYRPRISRVRSSLPAGMTGFQVVSRCGLALLLLLILLSARSAKAQGCANPVACENQLQGVPDWQTWGDNTLEGFATDISVNAGQTINFKINTTATSYVINIYRLGYYGGLGGRLIATINPSATLPQQQPACMTDSTTNLLDCGNWAVSASWQVPANAVSGLYLAQPYNAKTGGASHIPFVVRNDSGQSVISFQTSDETWEAYNPYPMSGKGHSLYGGPGTWDLSNRAYKVSYNRPYETRSFETWTWLFNAEYPMIRWLEANGYDVSYTTGVDAVRNANLITNHKVYLSVGHDEYWSGPQRTNIQAALAAGVNMAFFSGNEVFWKTRWEPSIDGTSTPYRTLVCYKETLANAVIDPLDPPTWTGTWADPRFSPPADGGLPQNALTGTEFDVNGPGTDNNLLSIKVPAAYGQLRFWRNTSIANLGAGQTATLPAGTLGYEWDSDLDNGFRPPGLFDLSSATYNLTTDLLLDWGASYGAGTATHSLTTYRAPSGALVFGAGTVQWAWGLDSNHDNGSLAPDIRIQQATVNLLADMGAQPTTMQSGLVAASKSTDTAPPTSVITYPLSGATIPFGEFVTVTGTASDAGGGVVAAVEVSVDGAVTWHRATPGTTWSNWSYSFTALTPGAVTIQSRAVDDSANLETPSAGSSVNVPGQLIGPDATVSSATQSASASISSPSFSTVQGNELLLAFIATDYLSGANTTVTGVTGAGLTWALVGRTNTQHGDAEIWRAFSASQLTNVTVTATLSQSVIASITVRTLTGVDSTGTNGSGAIGAVGSGSAARGAPTATLTTTRNGSMILGVGNDFDNAVARSPGTGQTVIYQDLTKTGDTYWVQLLNQVVPQAGTAATLNDVAPTTDSYNMTIVEVLPGLGPSYSISGSVSPSSAWTGTSVALTGQSSANASLNGSGDFAFNTLQNGQYTVTPNNPLYTFTPSSEPVTLNGSNATGINFTATPVPTYTVSGTISGGAGSTVSLMATGENGTSATTVADGSGNYSFSQVLSGNYTVTPSAIGFLFAPANRSIMVNGSAVTGVNFSATPVPTYTISGTISPVAIGYGTSVQLTGAATATVTADQNGNYSFNGLLNGNYTVTPSKTGSTFTPPSQSVMINSANSTANFTGTVVATLAMDVDVSVNGTKSATVTSPVFSTKSAGELLLAFISTDYLSGTNTSVKTVTGGGLTWLLVQRTNVQSGSAEIWRAFAATTLSSASVVATLSQSVTSSMTVVTFTGIDPSGTNGSGAIGAVGTANAKTGAPSASLVTTRNGSWVVGVGNDFDKATARTVGLGQTIVHQDVATSVGDTFWVQMQSSTTPLSGTTVTINDTAPTTDRYDLSICEILPAP